LLRKTYFSKEIKDMIKTAKKKSKVKKNILFTKGNEHLQFLHLEET